MIRVIMIHLRSHAFSIALEADTQTPSMTRWRSKLYYGGFDWRANQGYKIIGIWHLDLKWTRLKDGGASQALDPSAHGYN
ncbi:hypothetical protein Tco_0110354 [Tanacetum coccineum]